MTDPRDRVRTKRQIAILSVHGALPHDRNDQSRSLARSAALYFKRPEDEVQELLVGIQNAGDDPAFCPRRYVLETDEARIIFFEYFWSPLGKHRPTMVEVIGAALQVLKGIIGDNIGLVDSEATEHQASTRSRLLGFLAIALISSFLVAVFAFATINRLDSPRLATFPILALLAFLFAIVLVADYRAVMVSIGVSLCGAKLLAAMLQGIALLVAMYVAFVTIFAMPFRLFGVNGELALLPHVLAALTLGGTLALAVRINRGFPPKETRELLRAAWPAMKPHLGRVLFFALFSVASILSLTYVATHASFSNTSILELLGLAVATVFLASRVIKVLGAARYLCADLVIYLGATENAPYRDEREQIIRGLVDAITQFAIDTTVDELMLLGHSLGSAYLVEALYRLQSHRKVPRTLTVFLTFGSPLSLFSASALISKTERSRRDGLAQLFANAPCRWFNLHSRLDAVSYPMDWAGCTNRRIGLGDYPKSRLVAAILNPHGTYQDCPAFWDTALSI